MSNRNIIRLYDPMKDYDMVSRWFGENAPHYSALPQLGIVALNHGQPIACGWLYLDNRSKQGTVEHLIENPENKMDAPFRHIINFFQAECEKIGKLLSVDAPFKGAALSLSVTDEEFIDKCEAIMDQMPEGYREVKHIFTPGLYSRQIFMPAGTLCTSKIHNTEHPYVISMGDISVWTKEGGTVRLKAPHSGITKPGTRRILFAHADTIWTTFHVAEETDLDAIENRIITPHVNPLKQERSCLGGPRGY